MLRGMPRGSGDEAVNPRKTVQVYEAPPGATSTRPRRAPVSKKTKDLNKPKRFLPAFFYFANKERPRIRALYPELLITEISKEMGKRWNKMTPAEKDPFERLAAEDKSRYRQDMEAYMSNASTSSAKVRSDGQAVALPIHVVEDYIDDE